MRTIVGFTAAGIAAIAVGACGGGAHSSGPPVSALQRTILERQRGSMCDGALAQVMQRAFIRPSSSAAVRLRARKTLDLIAAHQASVEPVCASRSSAVPVVATP